MGGEGEGRFLNSRNHVCERRKSTNPKVPIGTTENNPRFRPWVASGEWPEPQRVEREDGIGPVRSFVPDGTRFMFAPQPSDKSLGYFRASLRDVELRHANRFVPLKRWTNEPSFHKPFSTCRFEVEDLAKHIPRPTGGEQPDPSVVASIAVGCADRRSTILPLPSDGVPV